MRFSVENWNFLNVPPSHPTETRLTWADSLAYAPGLPAGTHVVELSTLMGAVMVALDKSVRRLMTPRDDLATSLVSAAAAARETVWRLPRYCSYVSSLDSALAGVNSIGAKGGVGAGTITAGLFFAKFVRRALRVPAST